MIPNINARDVYIRSRYDWNSNMIYTLKKKNRSSEIHSSESKKMKSLVRSGESKKASSHWCAEIVCTFIRPATRTHIICVSYLATGNLPRHLMKHVILFLLIVFFDATLPTLRLLSIAFNVPMACACCLVSWRINRKCVAVEINQPLRRLTLIRHVSTFIQKKREKWNVKKCAHRCGFKRFHSLMPQVLFVSFWLTDLVRSLPLCSSIFLKKKRLTVLSLCLLLLRGHDRHIQHYILITASFMNWWQICLSNMYGRCSMCLHIRNVLYIEFQVDDDGNGDIFTAITLSIIESI